MGYKEDIQIDIDQLDTEWVKQAGLYQYYAKQEAMALYKRDQLADALALVQAQLDGDIRLNFGKHGFESKPTEAAILNSIKQNPFYTKANVLLMKASCKAKIVGGAVRSFDHKKKALEKLTDLYLSGYWAGPKIKSEAQEIYEKQIRGKIEADLKKEDRLTSEALKKEIGRLEERNKAGDNGAKVNKKRQPTVGKGAETKPKAKSKTKKDTHSGNYDPKTGERKPKPKPKPEPKPVGKTKEELLKQSRPASSPKSPGRKKK